MSSARNHRYNTPRQVRFAEIYAVSLQVKAIRKVTTSPFFDGVSLHSQQLIYLPSDIPPPTTCDHSRALETTATIHHDKFDLPKYNNSLQVRAIRKVITSPFFDGVTLHSQQLIYLSSDLPPPTSRAHLAALESTAAIHHDKFDLPKYMPFHSKFSTNK